MPTLSHKWTTPQSDSKIQKQNHLFGNRQLFAWCPKEFEGKLAPYPVSRKCKVDQLWLYLTQLNKTSSAQKAHLEPRSPKVHTFLHLQNYIQTPTYSPPTIPSHPLPLQPPSPKPKKKGYRKVKKHSSLWVKLRQFFLIGTIDKFRMIALPDTRSLKLALLSLVTATMHLQHACHELMQQPS